MGRRVWELLLFVAPALAAPRRRLVIGGTTPSSADSVVAIYHCPSPITTESPEQGSTCELACTGVFVSQNVVLTAQHCLVNKSEGPYGKLVERFPLKHIRVAVGAVEADQGNFYPVKKIFHNEDYLRNYYLDIDGDLSMLVLEDLIETVKPMKISVSKIHHAKCQKVTVQGFGLDSSTFREAREGVLRMLRTRIHSADVCRQAMKSSAQLDRYPFTIYEGKPNMSYEVDDGRDEYDQYGMNLSEPIRELLGARKVHYRFSEIKMGCIGGASAESTCSGDSGAPVTVGEGDSQFLIGIHVLQPGRKCGRGVPSYFVKLSAYASWISKVLAQNSKSPVKSSFEAFPLSVDEDSEIDRSRPQCDQNRWQCALSGECIPKEQLCDGKAQCLDQSDETRRRCPVVGQSSPFKSKNFMQRHETSSETRKTASSMRAREPQRVQDSVNLWKDHRVRSVSSFERDETASRYKPLFLIESCPEDEMPKKKKKGSMEVTGLRSSTRNRIVQGLPEEKPKPSSDLQTFQDFRRFIEERRQNKQKP